MNRTKQRIIEASLDLFNEQGERHVTTNHIAAHLGISPGNLYYHFRNKEEIIRAIFELYAEHWRQSLNIGVGEEATIDNMLELLNAVFDGLWRFRFFYANLPVLLGRDTELRAAYLLQQQELEKQLDQRIRQLVKDDVLALSDAQIPELVKTMRLIVTCWIGYQFSLSPDASITREGIHEGIEKILFLLDPWLTEAARPDVERLKQLYGDRMIEEQSLTNQV